ncbi:MAG TPA: SOS response-associated peptidase [Terracidiphilus sp.]|jgi:putative SOS response-associated peptidase YedK|nr:SOS response-associated peptidase [Terracidiphilus sp.]
MCGRFARRSTQEVLADWFGVALEDMPWFAPTFNAAPQSTQPILRLGRSSARREFALARWGLVPFWARDAKFGYSTINARAEEVVSKAAYREAFKKRRCLVPADAFYEWQSLGSEGKKKKTRRPYAIALRSSEPYAFAGIWESWKPKEGEALETFTILTTDPNELMEPIHDRMPVILEPRNYDRWLEVGDPAQPPTDLLRPYPAEKMRAWPVSDRVGNVRNDDPDLLAESQPDTEPPGLFG